MIQVGVGDARWVAHGYEPHAVPGKNLGMGLGDGWGWMAHQAGKQDPDRHVAQRDDDPRLQECQLLPQKGLAVSNLGAGGHAVGRWVAAHDVGYKAVQPRPFKAWIGLVGEAKLDE